MKGPHPWTVPQMALADTKAALAQPAVTLFEAGLVSGGKLVFIDILRKENDSLELIQPTEAENPCKMA